MPGASQAGAWRTKHSLLATNYEPKSPLRRADDRSDAKIVIVRGAPEYFPAIDHVFALDPSFEPTAPPPSQENEAVFADLQRYRGARLMVPDGEDHLYFAAINSKHAI